MWLAVAGHAADRWRLGRTRGVITYPRLLLPKAHWFPDVIAEKRRQVLDPHVAPLNGWPRRQTQGVSISRPGSTRTEAVPAPGCCSYSKPRAAWPPHRAAPGSSLPITRRHGCQLLPHARPGRPAPRPARGLERRALVPARRRAHCERHVASALPLARLLDAKARLSRSAGTAPGGPTSGGPCIGWAEPSVPVPRCRRVGCRRAGCRQSALIAVRFVSPAGC